MLTCFSERSLWERLAMLVALTWLLTGCMPPGPRAVLKGERLLNRGRVEEAVTRLEQAVELLPQEARAWNLLGMAYHTADRPADAERAYQQALAFDRNLAVARFNLGCLLLEQGQASNAVNELVTFTGLQVNSASGWLKLGQAQLRARQPSAADRSFREVLRLQTNSAPAFNGLGVSLVYRRLYPDAWRRFGEALQVDPNYAPALLNAGILAQQYLRDTNLATKAYERYLAQPNNPRQTEVQAILDRWANPPEPPPQIAATPEPSKTPTLPDEQTETPPEIDTPAADESAPSRDTTAAQSTPTPTNVMASTQQARPPEVDAAEADRPEPEQEPPPERKEDVAQAPTEPTRVVEAQPPPPRTNAPPPVLARANDRSTSTTRPATTTAERTPRPEPVPEPVLTPPRPPAQEDPPENLKDIEGPRYPYYAFGQARSGNRNEAIRLLNEGINDQRAFRTAEALAAYRRAVEVDPSLFETHYNRGVAAFELDELGEALRAYERALAVNPDSVPARFNFATTLLKSGYWIDAAAQLEALLREHPGETRAHLALGNLYADQFQDEAQASLHYQRVLELEPQHPNATSLRFWIEAH